MRLIQVSSPDWHELKHSIGTGSIPAGAFLVLGPSEEIARQAQALLEETSQQRCQIRYFLCSGNAVFRTPCFLSFPGQQVLSETPDVSQFLAAHLKPGGIVFQHTIDKVVGTLEQVACSTFQTPQLVLLEFLTPPSSLELTFTQLLLKSAILHCIPLVLLVHQQSGDIRLPWRYNETVENMLVLLYLCGGRMCQSDWHTLMTHLPDQSQCLADGYIATRRGGAEKWICYANQQIAEMAADSFQRIERARKSQLVRMLLRTLPHCTGYPLLAIASQADDLQTMLAVYSGTAAELALAEPKGLVSYFDRLRQVAYSAGDAPTADNAYVLYLATQPYLSKVHAVRVYQKVRGGLPASIDKRVELLFWFVLGQQLANLEQPEAWEYAAKCFRLSRGYLKNMTQLTQVAVRRYLASIANGEALIAYKLQQGEKARQLEEFALAQLESQMLVPSFQAHIETNLGDVFLHLLGDVEGALDWYGQALLRASQTCRLTSKYVKHPIMIELLRPSMQRAALKLGSTYLLAERGEEAIEILEYLLKELGRASIAEKMEERYARGVLKTRLTLAQACLQTGQGRRAALCYWQILRHPQRLEPDTLREVVERLGRCRPALCDRLRRRVERIVQEQEALRTDILKVQDVLIAMQDSLEYAMAA